jgi:hypothetical protein
MTKESKFPYVLGTRLTRKDGAWLSTNADSLRFTESSLARILILIGIRCVQKDPSLIFAGGADYE